MQGLAIIHFNAIEQYPPVLNLIRYLETERISATVYTVHAPDKFHKYQASGGIVIKRYGKYDYAGSIRRLLNYLVFYLRTFFALLLTRPSHIIYYETNSYLPAWLYTKLRALLGKPVKVHCHYHEYTEPRQYASGMKITKLLHRLERKNYAFMSCITHTNQKRLALFQQDTGCIPEQLAVFPNYPPGDWYKATVKDNIQLPVRLVYAGALSIQNMYVKDMVRFVSESNGKLTWDIYTQQTTDEAIEYIREVNSPHIQVKGIVSYFDLPEVLRQYDVGLILYNPDTLNYIYNETNKLFEYLSCGLSVWYSKDIKGIDPHQCTEFFPKVLSVDFEKVSEDLIAQTIAAAPVRKIKYASEEAAARYLQQCVKI